MPGYRIEFLLGDEWYHIYADESEDATTVAQELYRTSDQVVVKDRDTGLKLLSFERGTVDEADIQVKPVQ